MCSLEKPGETTTATWRSHQKSSFTAISLPAATICGLEPGKRAPELSSSSWFWRSPNTHRAAVEPTGFPAHRVKINQPGFWIALVAKLGTLERELSQLFQLKSITLNPRSARRDWRIPVTPNSTCLKRPGTFFSWEISKIVPFPLSSGSSVSLAPADTGAGAHLHRAPREWSRKAEKSPGKWVLVTPASSSVMMHQNLGMQGQMHHWNHQHEVKLPSLHGDEGVEIHLHHVQSFSQGSTPQTALSGLAGGTEPHQLISHVLEIQEIQEIKYHGKMPHSIPADVLINIQTLGQFSKLVLNYKPSPFYSSKFHPVWTMRDLRIFFF